MTEETDDGMKVSVLIPLHNARDVIRETIQTALNQTWTDREIVVVDDGSTDGSDAIVRKFGETVRCIRQTNAGVAAARNRAVAESTGEYLAFLDHDDLWVPTKLEKQVAVLDHEPAVGMVVTDVAHIDREGRPLNIPGRSYNPSEPFARIFIQGYVPTPSAAMIRRSVLSAVGGFDERYKSAGMDDHELWTRIAAHCEIRAIGEPLTYHRNRETKPPEIALEHRPLLIETLLERFPNDREKRRYLLCEQAYYLADNGKYLLRQGRVREGRRFLAQGLALSLGEARSWKAAWRCLSRIARSLV